MNKLIQGRAWSMNARTGVSQEDLAGVGHVLAMTAIREYDPTKGMTLTSWVYRVVSQGLWNFVKKQDRPPAENFDPDRLTSNRPEWNPGCSLGLKDMVSTLSSEAQWVCRFVLSGRLPKSCRTARQARGLLRRTPIGQRSCSGC